MDEMINFLLSVGPATLIVFIPYMIYTDIKYRTVSHELFYFIACVNLIPMFMLYFFNTLSIVNLIDSLVASIIIFILWKKFGSGAFSAADRNLLIAIFFLLVWTPWHVVTPTTYHSDFAFTYLITFIANFIMVVMFIPGILFAYNYIEGRRNNILQMLTYYPRGIPFIVPIAAAFYLTVVTV